MAADPCSLPVHTSTRRTLHPKSTIPPNIDSISTMMYSATILINLAAVRGQSKPGEREMCKTHVGVRVAKIPMATAATATILWRS